MKVISAIKPKMAILENVKHLINHDGGKTWLVIKDSLREEGYFVNDKPIILSLLILEFHKIERESLLLLSKQKLLFLLSLKKRS